MVVKNAKATRAGVNAPIDRADRVPALRATSTANTTHDANATAASARCATDQDFVSRRTR
jgi:hypothetical protein